MESVVWSRLVWVELVYGLFGCMVVCLDEVRGWYIVCVPIGPSQHLYTGFDSPRQ